MTAYFYFRPRTVRDLCCPHLLERETAYEIVKTITLSGIDYENFSEDLLADRQLIEDNAHLCSEGPVLRCLLVKPRNGKEGILVIPEEGAYVKKAAYITLDG